MPRRAGASITMASAIRARISLSSDQKATPMCLFRYYIVPRMLEPIPSPSFYLICLPFVNPALSAAAASFVTGMLTNGLIGASCAT